VKSYPIRISHRDRSAAIRPIGTVASLVGEPPFYLNLVASVGIAGRDRPDVGFELGGSSVLAFGACGHALCVSLSLCLSVSLSLCLSVSLSLCLSVSVSSLSLLSSLFTPPLAFILCGPSCADTTSRVACA
jgi:hypothetical protein